MFVYREFKSLEADLGFSSRTLYALSNNLKKHYKTVEIPKRGGGVRRLSVPDEVLKSVQRKIAEVILVNEPVSRYATAYRFGTSVQKNARHHVGKNKLLKLDIKNFFDSIFFSTVKEKVFPSDRFSEPVRVLLSILCYYRDGLPQGAPTSPAITNIVMCDFDEKVGAWCAERGITYTRYCDDMTFSGDFDSAVLTDFVVECLKEEHFFLNPQKTALVGNSSRQTVTGVVVNKKLNVPSDYRRKLRQELYFCRKYGVAEHLKAIGECDRGKYIKGLLGKVCFVLQTSPDNREFAEYKKFLCQILKKAEEK